MKVALLETVLEVSGQTERHRDDCCDDDQDVRASDSTQTTSVERVPYGDVAIHRQQHCQPDTQQTQEVNSCIHPREDASVGADVRRRTDITK